MKPSRLFYTCAHSLVPKYEGLHRCDWPRWLLLFREDQKQFEYLSTVFAQFPKAYQKDLLSRFFNPRENQHLSAWFEMMLLGWLSNIGQISFLKQEEGQSTPDMILTLSDGTQIFFEASVLLPPPEVQRFIRKYCHLWEILYQIQRPYVLNIKKIQFSEPVNWPAFKSYFERALDAQSSPRFLLKLNAAGVSLIAEAEYKPDQDRLLVINVRVRDVSPAPIKRKIREKVKQHRQIRSQSPFVIALYIAREDLMDVQIISAAFGHPSIVINTQTSQAVEYTIDYSGIFSIKRKKKFKILQSVVCWDLNIHIL